MKTAIRTILCAAAVMLAAVSCQESIEIVQPAEEGKGTIDISVNGLMGEYSQVDATRSELVNTIRVSWKGGETVYVYDGEKCLGSLVASLDENEDKYARLSTDGDQHKIMTPADGTTKLTLVHSPMLTDAPSISDGAVSISLAGQSGEKAPFVAYATLDYKGETTITGVVVPFKFATSVIKVNCTGLKANTAITSATLDNVNTVCKLTLSGSAAPTVSGDVNGTITRTGDAYFADSKVNSDGEAVFQIAVPALETASSARFLTVFQDSYKVKDRKFTTSSLNPATSVNTVCQLFITHNLKYAFSVSDRKLIFFSKGNLWADSNKALHFETNQWESTPSFVNERYGETDLNHVSHFTWANTVEKAISKNGYSQDYLFCDENHKQSVDGSANIYYALSKGEWAYLLEERTMLNGKDRYSLDINHGVSIESKNYRGLFLYPDNYDGKIVSSSMTWKDINDAGIVFLPAAAHRMDYKVDFEGTDSRLLTGYYWTSSYCYLLEFFSSTERTMSRSPIEGCSLRLVRDAQ